jgi:hypothetical protein
VSQELTELSVEELRAVLANKQEELVGVRAERIEVQKASEDEIQAAQLRQEIERVQGTIEQEKAQLDLQKQQDPKLIGTGILSLDNSDGGGYQLSGPPVEPTVPEAPVAPPVAPSSPYADGEPSIATQNVASEGAESDEEGNK